MKYPYLLLDADNTLFDFDAGNRHAFHEVCARYDIPDTEESFQCYKRCNNAMWAAFDRGECTKDFLVVERFRRFLKEMGLDRDAARCNELHLQVLGQNTLLLPHALEVCRGLSQRQLPPQHLRRRSREVGESLVGTAGAQQRPQIGGGGRVAGGCAVVAGTLTQDGQRLHGSLLPPQGLQVLDGQNVVGAGEHLRGSAQLLRRLLPGRGIGHALSQQLPDAGHQLRLGESRLRCL